MMGLAGWSATFLYLLRCDTLLGGRMFIMGYYKIFLSISFVNCSPCFAKLYEVFMKIQTVK
jgi:hypothetical protein